MQGELEGRRNWLWNKILRRHIFYVSDTIKHELERNKPLVDRILSDITYQSADNLVDGLTKLEEEGYNYAHYYGAGSQKTYKDDYK